MSHFYFHSKKNDVDGKIFLVIASYFLVLVSFAKWMEYTPKFFSFFFFFFFKQQNRMYSEWLTRIDGRLIFAHQFLDAVDRRPGLRRRRRPRRRQRPPVTRRRQRRRPARPVQRRPARPIRRPAPSLRRRPVISVDRRLPLGNGVAILLR